MAHLSGVLDRLPDEPWLSIEGLSGTSAGTMNSAVLVRLYSIYGVQRASNWEQSYHLDT
jgi:NTE family protein